MGMTRFAGSENLDTARSTALVIGLPVVLRSTTTLHSEYKHSFAVRLSVLENQPYSAEQREQGPAGAAL